jgi:demethylmenaquinone methyltransferase/2-methoxy-6-polyprenyl-1,4-benzoquinol methylase
MPALELEPVDRQLDEARLAASGDAGKRAYVRRMFSAIAPRYDLLNHVLSFNVDRAWRRRAVALLDVARRPAGLYLDVCAGTLDVGAAITRVPGFAGSVVGADFAVPMLRAGAGKAPPAQLAPVAADALALPLPDACCAGAIVAFGIRNVVDLGAALREVLRVLEPGASFVVLEFTTPRNRVVRAAYHAYFHRLLPRIGGAVSGNRGAYAYLPESVAAFPDERTLAREMERAGFCDVRWETMTLGIAAIHVGRSAQAAVAQSRNAAAPPGR